MSNEISNTNQQAAGGAAGGAISNINEVPEWMREDAKMGHDELSKFIIPPRLVITQALSNPPLDKYGKGTPIIMPNEQVISKFDGENNCLVEPFVVVPLFFFVEYTFDNPREAHSTHGAVRDRTFDPNSEIAIRASNPKTWEVPCPEMPAKMCKYTTRLNFILQIMDERFPMPVLMTYKRAEMKVGMAFNSLIKARRAPIFGCQYMADVGFRVNAQGKWYGLDIVNPPEKVGGWVQNKELYEQFKELHMTYVEAHEAKLIMPDLSEDTENQPEPEM